MTWLWNFFLIGRPITGRVSDKPLHKSCKIKCTETLSDNTVKHRCEECVCEKTVPDLRLPVGGKMCCLVNLEGIFEVPVRFTVVYGNRRGYAKCPMWDSEPPFYWCSLHLIKDPWVCRCIKLSNYQRYFLAYSVFKIFGLVSGFQKLENFTS